MTPEELECEQYIQSAADRALAEVAVEIDKAVATQQYVELEQLRFIREELQLMYDIAITDFRTNPVFRARMLNLYTTSKTASKKYRV